MKELLAIDIGNSNVKYGLFLDGKLTQTWAHPTAATSISCAETLKQSNAPVAIASVVPSVAAIIKNIVAERLVLELSSCKQTVLSGMPAEMGADRVADAVAAWVLYGKSSKAVVVCSFGTASTALVVDGTGGVLGGWIMPGITAQLEVMHERCALLPLLHMDKPSLQLGVDTVTHMRNGVFVGNVGVAREWLSRASGQVCGSPVSVATGGWAGALQEHGRVFDHVDPLLTLKGISLIASAAF